MANWNKSITLEITVNYITPHCTIGRQKYNIEIFSDALWCWEYGVWKAEHDLLEGHSLLITGKATMHPDGMDMRYNPTTYKVKVFDKGWGKYIKAKVIAYN